MRYQELLREIGLEQPRTLNFAAAFRAANLQLWQKYAGVCGNGAVESPSYGDSPIQVGSPRQIGRYDKTKESYARFNRPCEELEGAINSAYPALDGVHPTTTACSSGMSACVLTQVALKTLIGDEGVCIGEGSYFETRRVGAALFDAVLVAERRFVAPPATTVFWFDELTTTAPNRQLDRKNIAEAILARCHGSSGKQFYLVIDHTLSGFCFDIGQWLHEIPHNLTVVLITSLQKHITYGFDTCTGGAVTTYSQHLTLPEMLKQLRPSVGATVSEKSVYAMPQIRPHISRELVRDSGRNAASLAESLIELRSPEIRIHYDFDTSPLSSQVYIEVLPIGDHIGRTAPFPADILIDSIIIAAKENGAPLVHGESFGFCYTRVCKARGTLRDDVRLVRVAAGWDEELAAAAAPAIVSGIRRCVASLPADSTRRLIPLPENS